MESVRRRIQQLADSMATVLLQGETGTGKELVARALHEASPRKGRPFVAVNCAALPSGLIESLLFGHERGAFTGAERRVRGQLELAGDGTLLLDEIGELPLDLQAKLLRVLEEKSFRPIGAERDYRFSARAIAATHRDLWQRVREGLFRQDLYYRINVVNIEVPSLAQRMEDLPELLSFFGQSLERKVQFTDEALKLLRARPWRGNVRELRNLVERLSLLAENSTIDGAAIRGQTPDYALRADLGHIAREVLALPDSVGSKILAAERAAIALAIKSSGGNKTQAARFLGIHRKALERRLARLQEPEAESEAD
jgi:DNA-binding NtrC family response regulator